MDKMIERCLTLIFALIYCLSCTSNADLNIYNRNLEIWQLSYGNRIVFDMQKGSDNLFLENFYTLETDSCQNRIVFLRETISNYINEKDDKIFDANFLDAMKIAGKQQSWECFYPNKDGDITQLYLLGDSVLLEKAKYDERAMMLIINIYLLYSNSPEIAEYFGFNVVPKAAVVNTTSFIKVLSFKTEKEIDKCIRKLKILDDPSAIESIKAQINQINTNYRSVSDKISFILQ